jgi:malonyl-CoA O-methyltransferase
MRPDKEKIRDSFSKSAPNYDRHAGMQKDMLENLFFRLSRKCQRILDIGSGTGTLVKKIAAKYPHSEVVGLDLAPGMVEVARTKVSEKNVEFLVGDGESLPFNNQEFDLVVSSASLQWMDPRKVFAEVERVLKPGGNFQFTTFGPATLCELKEAGLSVNEFPDENHLKKLLGSYFDRGEVAGELVSKYYNDIFELIGYLREIGAQVPGEVRNRGLLSREKLVSLLSDKRPGIEVSYEIYYGSANS